MRIELIKKYTDVLEDAAEVLRVEEKYGEKQLNNAVRVIKDSIRTSIDHIFKGYTEADNRYLTSLIEQKRFDEKYTQVRFEVSLRGLLNRNNVASFPPGAITSGRYSGSNVVSLKKR